MRTIKKSIHMMLVLCMVLALVANGVSDAGATNKHTITIADCDHGYMTSDKYEAEEEVENVTITVYPDDGYAMVELAVMDKDRPDDYHFATPTAAIGDGTFVFTMPDRDVLVKATFVPLRTIKVGSELRLKHGEIILDIGIKGGSNWLRYRDLPAEGDECTMQEGQEAYVIFDPDAGYKLYRGFAAYLPVSGDGDRVYLDGDWGYAAGGGEGAFTAPEDVGDYIIEINASFHFAPLSVYIGDGIQNGSVAV